MNIEELKQEIYIRRDWLVGIFRRYGLENDAEDLADKVLVRAIEKVNTLKNCDKIENWLSVIAKNERRAYYREKKRHDEMIVDIYANVEPGEEIDPFGNIAGDKTVEKIFQSLEDSIDVMKLLNSLKPMERTIFLLHANEEHTFRRIADDMNLNMNTVKSIYRRSRISLMENYCEIFGEEAYYGRK